MPDEPALSSSLMPEDYVEALGSLEVASSAYTDNTGPHAKTATPAAEHRQRPPCTRQDGPPRATIDTPPPPHEIRWLTDALGVEATISLLDKFSGSRVYVPTVPNEGCPLAQAIGLDAALALAAIKGGETIKPPAAKAWLTRVYKAQGLSQAAIARKLRIDESTVARHLNPIVSHIAQLSMFD
jgi:hypothetical protein